MSDFLEKSDISSPSARCMTCNSSLLFGRQNEGSCIVIITEFEECEMTTISLTLPDELAKHLPADAASRQRVIELGLREWRIVEALEAYQRGEGTLAYAAERAGVSLRDMIVAA